VDLKIIIIIAVSYLYGFFEAFMNLRQRSKSSVTNDIRLRTGKASLLNIACRLHTLANRLADFPHSVTAQLFIIHARDFDVNINAVKKWTGDTFLIFGNDSRSTRTGFLCITPMSTWARIQCGEQLEDCREN